MTHEEFLKFEDKVWVEIKELQREALLDLLMAYDEYVYQIIHENEGEPVGVPEFYQYDYKEYVKGE